MSQEQNRTVLVVDDSSDERLIIRDYLTRGISKPPSVIEARDLEEARWYLEKTPLDCIILDYLMGAETGLDLLQELKGNLSVPPVIFLTGFADSKLQKESEQLGVAEFIAKHDIDYDNVRAAVDRIFDRAPPTTKSIESKIAAIANNSEH